MDVLSPVLGLVAGLALGGAASYFFCKWRAMVRQAEARADARSIIEDANRSAETARIEEGRAMPARSRARAGQAQGAGEHCRRLQ